MSARRAVADIIRVVDALGPLDTQDLERVARLLPPIASGETRVAETRSVSRIHDSRATAVADAASLDGSDGADRAPSPLLRRRRWARRWRARISLPSWAGQLAGRWRVWAPVLVALTGAVAVLAQLGLLPPFVLRAAGAALLVAAVVGAARVLVAWRRSPLLRSAARRSPDHPGGAVVLGASGELRKRR